ncbi:hypothetical protein, partial [Streptomyces radicis]
LTGDRTPTLHQGDGTQLPHRIEALDDGLLAIHRTDTTTGTTVPTLHDAPGTHHATLHRLPGDEHHALALTGNTPPRVIGLDGQTVPHSHVTPLPDDTGWVIHRPDHTPLIADRTGIHPTVLLTDGTYVPPHRLIVLPTHGQPRLISAIDGTTLPDRVTVHPEAGWITVQLDDGHRVHDMNGVRLTEHHVFSPEGHVTADSLMIRVNGQGSPDVLDMTGRPVPHTTTPFGTTPLGAEAHLVQVPGYPSTFVTAQGPGPALSPNSLDGNGLIRVGDLEGHSVLFTRTRLARADIYLVTAPGAAAPRYWNVPRDGSLPYLTDGNGTRLADTHVVPLEGLDSYLVRTPTEQAVLGRDGTRTHLPSAIPGYAANQERVDAVLVRPVDGNGATSVHHRETGVLLSDRTLTSFDGRRTIVEYQGPISVVYNNVGTSLRGARVRVGNPLGEGHHLVTAGPDGYPFVAGPDGAPVPGAAAARLGEDMYLIVTPGHRPGVVDAQGRHTHDTVMLRGAPDLPPDHFAVAPLDGGTPRIFTPDRSPATGLRLEPHPQLLPVMRTEQPNTQIIFDAVGRYSGHFHRLVDGPLLDHEVFLTGRQETSWVRGPEGDRVLNSRVTPLGGDRHLITVPDRPPVVLDTSTGAGQHIAVQLAPGDGGASRGIAVWPR